MWLYTVGSLVGATMTALMYERLVRALRLELHTARAEVQMLLTRLASRTPAEYHAVTAASQPVDGDRASLRYLYDSTGLQVLPVPDEDEL